MSDICTVCNGRGWELVTRDDGSVAAKECQCRKKMIAIDRLKRCGLSDEFKKKTLANYETDTQPRSEAKAIAIDYCGHFQEIKDTRNNSIMFMGVPGSGKTHLCAAVMMYLMNKCNVGVLYMPYREEITRIKQSITDAWNYQKAIEKWQDAGVLMIDDFLKGKGTEADVNAMFEIINYRYLKNLPMIISTEKNIDQLLDFDEAIATRLIEMSKGHIYEFKGRENNYRLKGVI